ncbi:MAG: glycoside hydrolase family 28 protein, partial [Acutalibacteraceae bacterium]
MKKRRLGMKIFLIVLICIFALVVMTVAVFAISYKIHSSSSTETIGKEETVYTTKDNGCRIANIPYDEYLKEAKAENSVIPEDLSEKNAPEDNSAAIEKAIEKAGKTGGAVTIPNGTYKITTVRLKSNVTLVLKKGTVLLSQSYEENQVSKTPLDRAVILAENCENVKITGGGTIDGNGLTYTNEPEKDEPLYALKSFNLYTRVLEARKRIRTAKDGDRANIIRLENCKNVTIDGVILKDSASWTAVFSNCEEVRIQNLIIDNHLHIANSDGIDITGGKDIDISHCFIATADDGVVLKSMDSDISNMTVSDCTVCSFANNFKIGTETEFDISD